MPLPHRCTVAITAVDGKIFLRFEPRVTPRQTIGDEAGPAIELDRIGFDLCSDIEDHGGVRETNQGRSVAVCLTGLGRLILSHVVAGQQAKVRSFGIEEN
jgi:hypothetical protein